MAKDYANLYAPNYKVIDRCLYEIKETRRGVAERKLCNFVPWIVREVTEDDGAEERNYIILGGEHERGRGLPEIQIPADELGSFNWLCTR